jgi:hypothetical protein
MLITHRQTTQLCFLAQKVRNSFTCQTVASEQGKQEQLEEKCWKGDLTNKVGQEAEQKTAGTMQKMR